jgi:WD40 repeat protein/DNA-binding SARP family transcriptional activator
VLAALVVDAGRVCAADRLADALYGPAPPATWRKVVQGSVGRLRQLLGPHAIATVGDGYRLELGDDELDARRFERLVGEAADLTTAGEHERAALTLEAALALSSSEPLADLDGWEPGRAAAARYDELRRLAEEGMVRALLASGQNERALAAAAELVVREPLREYRWVALALAQYRAGRQGEALRSITRARRALAEELGLDPGPDLVALERAILAQDSELLGPAESAGDVARCPYLGLAAYDLADADWFFGRDREIADCLAIVARTGFLAIVGASGSGKSSLARAGVAPALRRNGRPVAVVTPDRNPDAAFGGVAAGSVLVVDQLEALFALCDDHDVRARFIATIGAWSVTAPVIVTLRGDHLSAVAEFPELAVRVQDGLFLLGAMGESQLRAAIEVPATKVGLRLEPGLVDLLVRDVLGEPGALPLLSHALAETFEQREGPVLTVAGYRTAGGVQGAVARAADTVVDSLPPAGRRVAKDLFLRLVTATDLTEPVRQRIPRAALADDPNTEAVLDALVRTRLVIADAGTVQVAHEAVCRAWPRLRDWLDEDRDGIRIHQHLTRAAQDWEQSGREPSELYRGARLAASLEWAAGGSDLNPTEHAFLDASAAQRDADTRAAQDQLRQQQRTNRHLRGALAGVGVVLVLALVAGLIAWRQRDRADAQADLAQSQADRADAQADLAQSQADRADAQADLAQSEADRADTQAERADAESSRAEQRRIEADAARLAAQSGQLRAEQLPLSNLLAVEAERLHPSPASLSGLLYAANSLPPLRGFVTAPGPVFGVAIDPTGHTALAPMEDPGRELIIFDLERQRVVRTVDLVGEGLVSDLVFLEDGSALACWDDQLVALDPVTYQMVGRAIEAGYGCSLTLSRDGRSVAIETTAAGAGDLWRVRVVGIAEPASSGAADLAERTIQAARFVPSEMSAPFGLTDSPAAISPAGRLVALPMGANGLIQWDTDTGQPAPDDAPQRASPVPVATVTSAVAYSPDGRFLLVGDERGVVRFLSVDGLMPVGLDLDVGDEVSRIAFSPDGRRIAVGAGDGRVQIFDAETHRPLTPPLAGQGKYIYGLSFTPDGRDVVSASADGTVAIYDAEGRPTGGDVVIDGAPSISRTGIEVAVSPDGRLLATTHFDGSVEVWELGSSRRIDPGLRVPEGLSVGVAFSPDSRQLAAGDSAGNVVVWNVRTWATNGPRIVVPGGGLLVRLAYTTDGEVLVAGRETPPVIGFYDATTHHRLGRYIRPSAGDEIVNSALRGMAIDHASTRLATVEQFDTEVELWNVTTGRKVRTLDGFERTVTGASFDPSGRYMAVAETGGGIEIVDLRTGEPTGPPLRGLRRNAIDPVFSADGSLLAASSLDGTARVWDLETGLPIGPPFVFDDAIGLRETTLTFSPDGKSLVTSGPLGATIVWDLDAESLVEQACQVAGRNLTGDEWRRYMPDGMRYRRTCRQWPAPSRSQ